MESLTHVIARFKPGDPVTRRCCGVLDRALEADDDTTELVVRVWFHFTAIRRSKEAPV